MKRVLSLFLVLIVVFSLCSCSTSNTSKVKYSSIIRIYHLPAALGEPQYSEDDIKEMIATDLSLEEAAEKLTTLADVVQYLYLKGYTADGGDLQFLGTDGNVWHVNRKAEEVFHNNVGNCGGGSNLLNYLLRGDYDEQGYVQEQGNQGGHIYNYFKKDGKYYFCDLIQIVCDGNYNNGGYSIYVTDDPQKFSDHYIRQNHEHLAKTDPDYLVLQYMYPFEGNHRPTGDNNNIILMGPLSNIISKEIESTITVLYAEDPQYAPIFVDSPTVDLWPAEAQ